MGELRKENDMSNNPTFVESDIDIMTKGNMGSRNKDGKRDVVIKPVKAGLSADGAQRWNVSVRFVGDSYKKASGSNYVRVAVSKNSGRMYFWTGDVANGYRLSGNKNGKGISFTCYDFEFYESIKGMYDMLKDNNSGTYYIDFLKK